MSVTLTPKLLGLCCLAVLAVILTLGLWPFHAPANEVARLADRPGLMFGGAGTAIASENIPITGPASGGAVEIWLQPARILGSGSFLSFYSESSSPLQMRQSLTDLEIRTGHNGPAGAPGARLYVRDVFRKSKPVFLTIASGSRTTRIYLDGVLVRSTARFPLAAVDFTGRLVVGDSPCETDNWTGRVFGLAVYHRELDQAEIARHYLAWSQHRLADLAAGTASVALFPMDERAGNIVHDRSGNGVDLFIPSRYMVLDKRFLEPFWREFQLSWSYCRAALKNIVGFVPLGFSFCAWLTALHMRRAAIATVALGTAVSLTIELLQAYLPTRDSGTTDIFTNTLGTWIGVLFYNAVAKAAAPARFRRKCEII